MNRYKVISGIKKEISENTITRISNVVSSDFPYYIDVLSNNNSLKVINNFLYSDEEHKCVELGNTIKLNIGENSGKIYKMEILGKLPLNDIKSILRNFLNNDLSRNHGIDSRYYRNVKFSISMLKDIYENSEQKKPQYSF